MSNLAEWQAQRQKQRAEAATKNARARDEQLATMSNPDSNVDELGSAIRWFFLPVASIWVGYVGYIFAQKELAWVVDPSQATLLAIALPLFVQIIKVFAAMKALRAFHFKWYIRSAQDGWFWKLVGVVVVVMFVWSLKISVWDVKTTARENFIEQRSDSLSQVLAVATAPIDAQMNALNAENSDASSMKTKRGKIAWSGQQIKIGNSATLSSLTKQKEAITAQVLADYKSKKISTEKSAEHRGNFFQRFGGLGEVLEILFLLLLGLVEAINRSQNAERLGVEIDGKKGSTQIGAANNNGVYNNSYSALPHDKNPHQIGFFWDGYGSASKPAPPVSQTRKTVTQTNGRSHTIGCNSILLALRTKLQAEIPNFHNKHALPATVSGRIEKAFEDCWVAMSHPDFSPSRSVGAKVYVYLAEEAIPTLNQIGRPYSRDIFFMQKLLDVIPKEFDEQEAT